MASLMNSNLRDRVNREKSNKDLVDEYGTFWTVVAQIVGNYIFGILGAAADILVLFSIFYVATRNAVAATVAAVLLGVAIQLIYGFSLFKAAKNYFRGDYEKPGFKPMLYLTATLSILMLCATAFLSTKTDKLVFVAAEQNFELQDESGVNAYYDSLATVAATLYTQDRDALTVEANRLNSDKIMWKGKWTTRERSSRQAAKITGEELPALRQSYENEKALIEERRNADLLAVRSGNTAKTERFEQDVIMGGNTSIGFNLAINLLRGIIIIWFANFIVNAGKNEKESTPATSGNSVANRVAAGIGNVFSTSATQPATASAPSQPEEPDEYKRTVVQGFQQRRNSVANRVAEDSPTVAKASGNGNEITIIDGKPTYPYRKQNGDIKHMTAPDVARYIAAYRNKPDTENNRERIAFFEGIKTQLDEAEKDAVYKE